MIDIAVASVCGRGSFLHLRSNSILSPFIERETYLRAYLYDIVSL